ncbi:hypothetical protein CDAR_215431 [Caerostris darwini]|uniref:Uncharacterized protein n=1 Tax=Caerostris darwini TaxID=1538125 RepID=A0AAV4U7E0_9ARAC|nr:hypothetical protein CDAR_215431 [Caerostris darwini]
MQRNTYFIFRFWPDTTTTFSLIKLSHLNDLRLTPIIVRPRHQTLFSISSLFLSSSSSSSLLFHNVQRTFRVPRGKKVCLSILNPSSIALRSNRLHVSPGESGRFTKIPEDRLEPSALRYSSSASTDPFGSFAKNISR